MGLKNSSTAKRVLASLGVLGTLGAIAGLATYATFTSSTNGSHSVSSGTVTLTLGTSGTSANRLSDSATDVAAGDTMQRAVDLINGGSIDLSSIKLTTTASPSSNLDTDTTNGLHLDVDLCSQAWTESGSAPAWTYTCGGTTTSIISNQPVIMANTTLSGLSLTHGNTNHLRLKLTVPTASTQAQVGGASSTIDYAFTSTQRAATDK